MDEFGNQLRENKDFYKREINPSALYVFGKKEMVTLISEASRTIVFQMLVNTRCKYVPILTIYKIKNEKKQQLKQFVFEETQFITAGKIMVSFCLILFSATLCTFSERRRKKIRNY